MNRKSQTREEKVLPRSPRLHSRRRVEPAAWPRAPFPGARLARIADAPPRCPNCGGPWRRLLASVACMTCPTELYAVAELTFRAGGDEPSPRVPTVRPEGDAAPPSVSPGRGSETLLSQQRS